MDTFHNLRTHKEPTPKKFTIAMGEIIIRKVRIEAKLTQAELAERGNFNQTAILQIELEKRDVSVAEILYFNATLDKPILYFFATVCECRY